MRAPREARTAPSSTIPGRASVLLLTEATMTEAPEPEAKTVETERHDCA